MDEFEPLEPYAFESICPLCTKFCYTGVLFPHCPNILHPVLTTKGYGTKVKGLRFFRPGPTIPPPSHPPNSSPMPTLKQDQPNSPTLPLSPTVSPLTSSHSFFCFCFILIFFDNAILKALCLVIPLCEHVNDNLLQKC